MSYSTLMMVWPGEKVECGPELSNSWGTAPVIWDLMAKMYLGKDVVAILDMERVCDLARREDIAKSVRAVLRMTFDNAYIKRANYVRASRDIGEFFDFFTVNDDVVNHWPKIQEFLDSDPDVPAIGFWATSVSDCPFMGDGDEEYDGDAYTPFDWSRAWEVYEESTP